MPAEARAEPQPIGAPPGRSADVCARVAAYLGGRSGGLCGVVAFARGLPLVGLKARLVYEKLACLGDVFFCEPAAETLDELETLESLVFGVATDEAADVVRGQLGIAGVESIHMTSIAPASAGGESPAGAAPLSAPEAQGPLTAAATSEAPLDVRTRAASVAVRPAPTTDFAQGATDDTPRGRVNQVRSASEVSSKPTETLRVDIERLDQLMSLAGELAINKARFNRIGDSLRQATAANRAPEALAGALVALEKIAASAEPARFERFVPGDLESIRAMPESSRLTSRTFAKCWTNSRRSAVQ